MEDNNGAVKIRGAGESLSVNGVINSTQMEAAMGLATYSALNDSHSLVNQQLQSNVSLPSSQTKSSLITRKTKGKGMP